MFNCNNLRSKPFDAKRSRSIQEGMVNALGAASTVGGRVAGVEVDAPVAPANDSTSSTDEEVRKYA